MIDLTDIVVTCDRKKYMCDAENRMITFAGERGETGPQGDPGRGITSIGLTSTVGLVDTYTITYSDGTTSIYTVTNGTDGASEWGDIAGDLDDQTDLADALAEKAPVIHNSASGSIVSIDDGTATPVSALTVNIDPVQDLHGYDNPWPAGGGKNLYNSAGLNTYTSNGITVTESNGTLTLNNTATANAYFTLGSLGLPQGNYTFSANNPVANSGIRFSFRDADGNYFAENSLSSTNNVGNITNKDVNSITMYVTSGTSLSNFVVKPQLETGTTATSFAPYSNLCPISGHTSATVQRTGKNLLPTGNVASTTINDVTIVNNGDGTFNVSGTSNKAFNFVLYTSQQTLPKTFEGAILSGGVSGNVQVCLTFYNDSNIWVGALFSQTTEKTISIPNGATKYTIGIRYGAAGASYTGTIYPMIRLASETDDTYEAYTGTSVTIDLGGTRYGGTLDVLTGVLMVDRVFWTKNTSTMDNGENYPGWANAGIRDILPTGQSSAMVGAISNISSRVENVAGKNSFVYNTVGNNDIIYLPTTVWNKTQTQWKADAIDVQLVIPLATPLTVQLTAQQLQLLQGDNNVWADTGDVSLTYRADTKTYLENRINDIKLLLTPNVETEMKASKNYASGSIVIVGNAFLKLTSAVASGATLTIGSNCTETTMAEWVASLV